MGEGCAVQGAELETQLESRLEQVAGEAKEITSREPGNQGRRILCGGALRTGL